MTAKLLMWIRKYNAPGYYYRFNVGERRTYHISYSHTRNLTVEQWEWCHSGNSYGRGRGSYVAKNARRGGPAFARFGKSHSKMLNFAQNPENNKTT
jgi:hypothetical protein